MSRIRKYNSVDIEKDFAVRAEWMDEVTRRCREIDEGRVARIPGKDALAQLRKQVVSASVRIRREEQRQLDRETINRHAEQLNAETQDALRYQKPL